MAVAVFGFSFPVFVLAYVLISVFSIQLEWLPVEGYTHLRDGFGPFELFKGLAAASFKNSRPGVRSFILLSALTDSAIFKRTDHSEDLSVQAERRRYAGSPVTGEEAA